ncbi:MAG: DUF1653 domain-containing protein [Butyrivibrio sp.]
MERTIQPGEIYRHFKNKLYQIIAVAYHSETKEKYVVYQALYGTFQTYIRPYDMFMSEVDHVKYPDVVQKYRFEKINSDELGSETEKDIENTGTASSEETANQYEKDNDTGVNPCLLEFLDKDTVKERIEYLRTIRNKVDERLISDMAAAMDITINEGTVEEQFDSLMSCLNTMARFECGRLR